MILTHLVCFRFFGGAGGTVGAPAVATGYWLLRARRRLASDD